MKLSYGLLGLVIVALCGVGLAMILAGSSKSNRQASVPGEALVQFRAGVTPSQVQQLIAKTGATLKEKIDPQQIYVVRFPLSVPPQEMLNRFRQMPEVVVVEPNGVYEVFSPENRKGG
jgi:TPP-dependent indolepyruvate ferredoxin oxidoreductase alpha subunit